MKYGTGKKDAHRRKLLRRRISKFVLAAIDGLLTLVALALITSIIVNSYGEMRKEEKDAAAQNTISAEASEKEEAEENDGQDQKEEA